MLANGVKETTTTTGTGTVTLVAVTGRPRFADAFSTGVLAPYAINSGNDWEWGMGTVSAANTLARTILLAKYDAGAYANDPATGITLAGTSTVLCTASAMGQSPSLFLSDSGAAGRWMRNDAQDSQVNTKALNANTMVLVPFVLRQGVIATGLVANVTTLAGAGTDKLRLGIYEISSAGGIGALIAETADADPSTTGVKSPLFSSVKLIPAGFYWVGALSNVAPTIQAGANASTCANQAGFVSFTNGVLAVTVSVTSGWTALPAGPLTIASRVGNSDYPPTCHILVK